MTIEDEARMYLATLYRRVAQVEHEIDGTNRLNALLTTDLQEINGLIEEILDLLAM